MKTSTLAAVSALSLILTVASASAATLLSIEFKEDDQDGFDLWPASSPLTGTSSTAVFTTPETSSGTTTITVTATSSLSQALNRAGSTNGTPPGFTYQRLYEDLLIAAGPTGALSLFASGLDANTPYQFTLFAWDPGDSVDRDRQWTVQTGTGDPSSATLNWSNPLVDNNTFTMNFKITTDGAGEFSLMDTGALQGSAINGFILAQVPEPSAAVLAALGALGLFFRRRR